MYNYTCQTHVFYKCQTRVLEVSHTHFPKFARVCFAFCMHSNSHGPASAWPYHVCTGLPCLHGPTMSARAYHVCTGLPCLHGPTMPARAYHVCTGLPCLHGPTMSARAYHVCTGLPCLHGPTMSARACICKCPKDVPPVIKEGGTQLIKRETAAFTKLTGRILGSESSLPPFFFFPLPPFCPFPPFSFPPFSLSPADKYVHIS